MAIGGSLVGQKCPNRHELKGKTGPQHPPPGVLDTPQCSIFRPIGATNSCWHSGTVKQCPGTAKQHHARVATGARGPGPTTPRRLDRPLVASEAAPCPRWTPGCCLRAPISQCPGTTGTTKTGRCPSPATAAPRSTARRQPPAAFAFGYPSGGFWGPILPPRRPRVGHEG
jgi:hypothetical protein